MAYNRRRLPAKEAPVPGQQIYVDADACPVKDEVARVA